MQITPVHSPELHHPGWEIVDQRGYEYALFAPVSSRDVWQAQWRNAEGDDGGLTTDSDADKVLITFPIRVAAAFRPVVDEYLSRIETNEKAA